MEQPPTAQSSEDVKPVPEELMGKLHEANAEFHKSKEHLEAEMDAPEYRQQERVNKAEDELFRAEREVEKVEGQIEKQLETGE